MSQYTAKYFIEFFRAIPDDQWRCDGRYGEDGQPKCALGHCGQRNTMWDTPKMVDALYTVLSPVTNVGVTNDRATKRFPQLTPKARILAALELAKTL